MRRRTGGSRVAAGQDHISPDVAIDQNLSFLAMGRCPVPSCARWSSSPATFDVSTPPSSCLPARCVHYWHRLQQYLAVRTSPFCRYQVEFPTELYDLWAVRRTCRQSRAATSQNFDVGVSDHFRRIFAACAARQTAVAERSAARVHADYRAGASWSVRGVGSARQRTGDVGLQHGHPVVGARAAPWLALSV